MKQNIVKLFFSFILNDLLLFNVHVILLKFNYFIIVTGKHFARMHRTDKVN